MSYLWLTVWSLRITSANCSHQKTNKKLTRTATDKHLQQSRRSGGTSVPLRGDTGGRWLVSVMDGLLNRTTGCRSRAKTSAWAGNISRDKVDHKETERTTRDTNECGETQNNHKMTTKRLKRNPKETQNDYKTQYNPKETKKKPQTHRTTTKLQRDWK